MRDLPAFVLVHWSGSSSPTDAFNQEVTAEMKEGITFIHKSLEVEQNWGFLGGL